MNTDDYVCTKTEPSVKENNKVPFVMKKQNSTVQKKSRVMPYRLNMFVWKEQKCVIIKVLM